MSTFKISDFTFYDGKTGTVAQQAQFTQMLDYLSTDETTRLTLQQMINFKARVGRTRLRYAA